MAGSTEVERLAVLRRYDVLDRPPEPDLEAIARLAARLCGVPAAAVNLVDDRTQHPVATEGVPRLRLPREQSLCGTTITLAEPVHVPDLQVDSRFRDNPMVAHTGVRFYAASQLRTGDGHVLGTLCVFDSEVRRLDDEQRAALDDLAGQVVHWLELRRRARELQEAVGELARSNADLAQFAGRVAHDLRNPLAAVLGFLSLAEHRFGDGMSAKARTVVSAAHGAAARMRELVDDLLDFSSVGVRPVMEPVNLGIVAAEVIEDLSPAIQTAGASVRVEDLPVVPADHTMARQLLQNLVGNALKFTRPDVAPAVVVRGDGGPEGWTLEVADNGRGIPEADRPRVFDLFVRGSNASGQEGTGIGLATCARIATAFGGRLDVSETPGGGTTFTLTVPGG